MKYVLKDLLLDSKDGEWGKGEPNDNSVAMLAIRGTDFDDVRVGSLARVPLRHIPDRIARRKALRPFDIVFETAGGSKDRPTGRSVLLKPSLFGKTTTPITCASFARFLRIDPARADPVYIFWMLQHMYESDVLRQYHTQHTGVARYQYTTFAENEPLFLPKRDAQRRIASVLSAYDDLIENNTRRIAILEEMARRIYEEWFVRFRFPGFEAVQMVESELGLVPEGCKPARLEQVCSRMNSGNTPSRSNPDYWAGGSVDWYKTKELWDGYLFESEERVSDLAVSDKKTRVFEPGTILMAIYGSPTVGRMGITTRRAACNQAALGMFPDTSKIQFWTLYYTLFALRAEFNNKAQGAAQQNISKEKVAEASFVLPPMETQSRFEEIVGPMQAMLRNLQERNRNLRTTRDLLLPKLISGELDVSAPPEPEALAA